MKVMLHFAAAIAVSLLVTRAPRQESDRSDAELLELGRNRGRLERVTSEPVAMFSRLMLDCRAPIAGSTHEAANPHSSQSVHVYASDNAVAPLWDLYAEFPEGSLLIKEKFDPAVADRPILFTGMLKREPGYFPEGGDWEYFTLDGELSRVTSRGKLESCAACHRDFADWGYVSKQYTSVPVDLREYVDSKGVLANVIGPGSSGTLYLPASRAETHGPKLGRREAEHAWWKGRAAGAGVEAPQDLSVVGGPALRYELDKTKNTLGYWTNADDWASWEVDIRRPGEYRVSVLQGCGEGSGGAEVSVNLGGDELTFLVEDTGGFQNFKWRDVGSLTVDRAGMFPLIVKARTKPGPAVMDLRQIILRPAAAGSEQ